MAAGAAPPAPAVEVLPKAAMAWDPVQEQVGSTGEQRLEPVAPVGGGNGAGQGGAGNAGGHGGTGHHTPDQARGTQWLAAACTARCRAAPIWPCGLCLPMRNRGSVVRFWALPALHMVERLSAFVQIMAAVLFRTTLR